MNLTDDPKRALACAGAVVLTVGAFTPLVSGRGEHATLMAGQPADGVVLLVLAAGSVALGLTGRYGGLWLTGIGALLVLGFAYVNLALPNTGGAAWGWIVLGLGAAMLLIAAGLRERFVVAPAGACPGDDPVVAGERWSVVAGSATGETRQALRGILWGMNRDLTEAEVQKLLNADEIPVASGLTAAEANQLMTRLYEAGIAARKRRAPAN